MKEQCPRCSELFEVSPQQQQQQQQQQHNNDNDNQKKSWCEFCESLESDQLLRSTTV